MRSYKILFFVFVCIMCYYQAIGQSVAWGVTAKIDMYNRYANPSDDIASRSAGSALANIGIGPKMWIGSGDFAISPEASFMFSPFALSSGNYKGLGAFSVPVLVKMEFLGNSNVNHDGKFGFSLGGGLQWSKTELWYLKDSFEEQGVTRSFFRTYIAEADFGYGMSGFNLHLYVRYGWSGSTDANTLNIGLGFDFNIPKLRRETNADF